MYVFINYRKHINLFHPLQHDISLSPRGLVFSFVLPVSMRETPLQT